MCREQGQEETGWNAHLEKGSGWLAGATTKKEQSRWTLGGRGRPSLLCYSEGQKTRSKPKEGGVVQSSETPAHCSGD